MTTSPSTISKQRPAQEESRGIGMTSPRCAATPAQNSTVGSSELTAATIGSHKKREASRTIKDPESKKIELNGNQESGLTFAQRE